MFIFTVSSVHHDTVAFVTKIFIQLNCLSIAVVCKEIRPCLINLCIQVSLPLSYIRSKAVEDYVSVEGKKEMQL